MSEGFGKLDGKDELQRTLRAAAAGDGDAWRAIVDAYTRRVHGLIRAQCGNPELAEEITQSTFCTIVEKIGSYTELGKFEAWLFRIAMNRLRDEMRRRKRQARPMESEKLIGLAGGVEPEADAFGLPVGSELAAALDKLSDSDRRIIHLRHVADLSFKQIAELLDEPLGTVLARQHRALRKLRDHLRGTELDEE